MTYQYRADYMSKAALLPTLMSSSPTESFYARRAKRLFDVLVVALVSVPVLVILLVLALFVAMDGHSPFYIQNRIGRHGRIFKMIKLRTMVNNADAVLQKNLARDPVARAEWDEFQKLRHDPRITRIGRILRKASLDELPQLINVVLGDMSIVGPRPMMEDQRSIYPGTEYYRMRPGITGFWQISSRNDSSFSDRAHFDRDYFHGVSFVTDLRVMWRTVSVVIKGTGC